MNPRDWIERVYADVPGTLVVSHQDASGAFHGTGGQAASHDDAAQRIEKLDASGARGVYLRVTTVKRSLGTHERGTAEDSGHLPGLWADVDLGDVGHAHDPALYDGLTLPPDEDAARRIVTGSGLPTPSLWVHSGGGLYPWWLLDQPVEVTDENRTHLEALSARWQGALASSAARLGYHYGTGVGDLARVLRVPGTTNRKAGVERPCRLLEDHGTVYAPGELLAALPRPTEAAKPLKPAPRPAGEVWGGQTGPSVFDRFAAETSWGDLLARYGFSPCTARHSRAIAECFTRPGGPEHTCSAHVLAARPEVLVVWSDSAGLPVGKGQKLTKARVLAHMEHRGDLSAAAHALGGTTPAPVSVLAHPDPAPVSSSLPLEAGAGTTDDQTEAALDAAHALAVEIEREAYRLRVREAARAKVDAEKTTALELPALRSLTDFLAEPDPEVTHRIAGLWPTGGRVVLSAPHKSGKTTLSGNLTRSLADGDDFLDAFPTKPAARVVLLDNELDEAMLRRWLRDQGIANTAVVELIPLRGRLSTFNILDPATRSRWAEHIGPADAMIFDCLRPALDALGLSEDKDAGRFLEALDELNTEAGISEALIVHHMGHSGERSRGDSRILDWPDALWKLVKDAEDEDDAGERRVYFTAYGRDVNQPEARLAFDPATRRLSIGGGSRKDARAEGALGDVTDYVDAHPQCSQNAIEKGVGGKAEVIRKALRLAIERGLIHREKAGQRYLHTTASHCVPTASGRSSANRVPASIDADADAAPEAAPPDPGTRTQLEGEEADRTPLPEAELLRRPSYFPDRCECGFDHDTQAPLAHAWHQHERNSA